MNPIHILLRLHSGYGLGDGVQMTAVLRHLRKHRPNWLIDYQADRGRHSAAIALVRNAFTYDDPRPCSSYDGEIDIYLYDRFAGWPDRPNTRVTSCLHERFGMEWDRECASYEVVLQEVACRSTAEFLASLRGVSLQFPTEYWTGIEKRNVQFRTKNKVVCIHYQGDSAKDRKDLTHEQAAEICKEVIRLGRIPLLMDWRNTSPLPDQKTIHTTGRLATSLAWGGDAQMNCAIISQCEAFVGIDSGPGKCASATSTPALICWTKQHPALYHDPCPNTTHLVPSDHRQNELLKGNAAVAEFFEKEYAWRSYFSEKGLVLCVKEWLGEILK